jgi:predicted nuclease with TOPRIM domain
MLIEVSNGEIIDKITILEIKLTKIKNPEKLKNIKKEFDLLYVNLSKLGIDQNHDLYNRLKEINLKLWDIEDLLRIKEQKKEFDDEFIQLARSVYVSNDKRAEIKREINALSDSYLSEEKEYVDYQC